MKKPTKTRSTHESEKLGDMLNWHGELRGEVLRNALKAAKKEKND